MNKQSSITKTKINSLEIIIVHVPPTVAHSAGCCSGTHSGNLDFGTGPWGSCARVDGGCSDGLRDAAVANDGSVADRSAPQGSLAGTGQRFLPTGGIAQRLDAAPVAAGASIAAVAESFLPER